MSLAVIISLFGSLAFGAFDERNVTPDSLESYVNQTSSVEEFISNLSPETRAQFVLMHTSKSLQEAQYQKPRVIMYTKFGQMLLSFNDASLKNGDKVEVILFDKQSKTFSAHEIDYSADRPKLHRNPQKCIGCHGVDLRPNWNTYSFWDGAYAGYDSRLSRPAGMQTWDISEYEEIQKFVKTYKNHPRYKYLEHVEDHATPANGIAPESSDVRDSFRVKSQNLEELTLKITRLNNKRVRRILSESPEFEHFKYAFLSLMSCEKDHFERSLPENFLPNVDRSFPYLVFRYDPFSIGKIRDRYYLAFLDTLGIDPQFLDTTFNLTYPIDLYQDPIVVSYSTSRFSTGNQPKYEFAYEWTQGDPDFIPYVYTADKESQTIMVKCDELAIRAKTELQTISLQIKESNRVLTGKKIFEETCLRCHTRPEITLFNFSGEDLGKLLETEPSLMDRFEERLNVNTPRNRRMPLGIEISPFERRAVKEYIESFRPRVH